MYKEIMFILVFVIFLSIPTITEAKSKFAKNPIIWADVPDPSVIRVGNVYYMSSTTMHMSPGVPIMKSKDLVNWEIVNYVYDVLGNDDRQTLKNGQNEYGRGSWASSLRYHNGVYYVVFSSQTAGSTFIFQTRDIENGPWEKSIIDFTHDMSLLFDEDDRVYMVYGGGDIKLIELTADATGIKEDGFNQVIIPNASAIAGSDISLPAEGGHIHKINGKYYIFLITWPRGGIRTELVYKADRITGPYVGKVVLSDSGIAQGGLVDTVDGDWYAMLFQDSGSVGRIPFLVPVTWEADWPIFGSEGKVSYNLPINVTNSLTGIVASDEFEQGVNILPLVWQWNHNPDNDCWSLTERLGYLRLTTSRIAPTLLEARNTLTQRTFGPQCSGEVALEISNMKDGDFAGLGALQKHYGFVGIKMEKGIKSIIMVDGSVEDPLEVESIKVNQDTVYFRVDFDFRNKIDRAYFYYSLDGGIWTQIGNVLKMSYTLPHFMGYRFALFNYATTELGGFVDFDYFRIRD